MRLDRRHRRRLPDARLAPDSRYYLEERSLPGLRRRWRKDARARLRTLHRGRASSLRWDAVGQDLQT
jgi:hypothetical protein